MSIKDEAEKIMTVPYDITGKEEIEVRCEVYSRLLCLNSKKNMSCDDEGLETTLNIAGKDTLFHVVASSFLVFCEEGANAALLHIEAEVHKLFVL